MSEDDAKKYSLICFYRTEKEIKVGSPQPLSEEQQQFIEQLKENFDVAVIVYLISAHSFNRALAMYANLPKITPTIKGVNITEDDLKKFETQIQTISDLQEKIQKIPLTDLFALVMAAANKFRASDIHIEAEEQDVKMRFRVDGMLVEAASLKKEIWPQIISRIKLFSSLKINIIDKPQDGRFTIFLTNDKIDVRVSTLPTAFGESVVMRLLRSSAASLQFDQLGISEPANTKLLQQIQRPNGMIMTTGPTGSGKTTTLYAILNKLNSPETKIITLEDPVEYKLAGIAQSQIDQSHDYTFAKGLRAILRQDPDVIMVGEIRDIETADTAVQSALTGHLVISTLHTNDAAGAIPRFLSMGVKPYLLAPALNAVIGQRLCRRLCNECKKEIQLNVETLEKVKKLLGEIPQNAGVSFDINNLKFYGVPEGENKCEKCQGIGYKGRVGIYEVLLMDAEIEKAVLSGTAPEYLMRELATKQGMVTMAQDGLLKCLQGTTSVDEVFRVAE